MRTERRQLPTGRVDTRPPIRGYSGDRGAGLRFESPPGHLGVVTVGWSLVGLEQPPRSPQRVPLHRESGYPVGQSWLRKVRFKGLLLFGCMPL